MVGWMHKDGYGDMVGVKGLGREYPKREVF